MATSISDIGAIQGCDLLDLTVRGDERGQLVALERSTGLPFDLARVYFIYGTTEGTRRGFHAHRTLRQLAVCVRGECTIFLDDGVQKADIVLDRPDRALTIAPKVWHEMHDFSPDCVLMVLADAPYDEADYLRSYDTFLKAIGRA